SGVKEGSGHTNGEVGPRGGFFTVANAVVTVYGRQIGADGIAVYAALACHAGRHSREAWPSLDLLCAEVCLCRHTAVKAIRQLERLGLVAVQRPRGGRGNTYELLPVPAECTPCTQL